MSVGRSKQACLAIVCTFFVLLSPSAYGQWTTDGVTTYNTNEGNVGIGTATPGVKLGVAGPAAFGKSVENALWIGPLSSAPAYFYIDTKIPFTDVPSPQIKLTGYTYGHEHRAVSLTLGWYVWQGSFHWTQVHGDIGYYMPSRIRLGTYDDSGTTRIRIEIANDNIYWSSYTLSAFDSNGPTSNYAAWSYAVGPFPEGTGNITIPNQFPSVVYTNSGNVGVGTSTPEAKLDINGFLQVRNPHSHIKLAGASSNGVLMVSGNNLMMGNWDSVQRSISVDLTSGNVGIGTTNPSGKLHVNSPDASAALVMGSTENAHYTDAIWLSNAGSAEVFKTGTSYSGWGGPKSFNVYTADGPIAFHPKGLANVMYLSETGNVGIGMASPQAKLHVDGNIVATTMSMTYQDVAEWVPASKAISAGTVVIVDPKARNQVLPSPEAYDTRVAGVVSGTPGILLGEAGDGKVKVATTGRVKVRVDASRARIEAGDLLVTSEKEGTAMKSVPIEFAGRRIHQPGTLIGKALEPLAEGEGEILVLLSLQ